MGEERVARKRTQKHTFSERRAEEKRGLLL
jgi:hypothetical protein